MPKKVSIIISTYTKKRVGQVIDCIKAIKKQSFSDKEIILVLDPDKDLIEAYKIHVPAEVKIVVSSGYGLSNARNAGIENGEGEIMVFIDDDALPADKWLENLVKNYEDSSVVGVGGFIMPIWQRYRPKWFPEELYWLIGCSYKGLPRHKTVIRNPIGCNMSFRKNVFKRAGVFDSNIGRFGKKLLSGEEPELSFRIRKKMPGSKIIYDPSAVVYHRIDDSRNSFRYLLERSFYEGLSKALISSKQGMSGVLSTEDSYLTYLFRVAVPSKLKRIHRFESLCQLLALFFSISFVFLGFLSGKISRGR
jgi:glycosyltransferase involved in cell wall biosynthesis